MKNTKLLMLTAAMALTPLTFAHEEVILSKEEKYQNCIIEVAKHIIEYGVEYGFAPQFAYEMCSKTFYGEPDEQK